MGNEEILRISAVASYMGIEAALTDIKENKTQEVPLHLKNATYDGEKKMGKHKGYKYPHSFGGYVEQEYMPEKKTYYEPKDIGFEKKIKERMARFYEKKED